MAQTIPSANNRDTSPQSAPLTMLRAVAAQNAKSAQAATAAQNVRAAQAQSKDGPLGKLSGRQLQHIPKESLSKMSLYKPQTGGASSPAVSVPYAPNRNVFRGADGAPTSNNVMGTQKQSATEGYSGCKTCQERTYQDGSDDAGVSFQTPKHISSAMAGVAVASHEGEHVTRETDRAAREGRIVTQKSVTFQMGCCPECHKMYVAGGTTKISTMADKSATADNSSILDLMGSAGENVDMDV